MSLFDDQTIRDNLLTELDEAIKIKKERGINLANKEYNYRVELTKAMAEGMISGLEVLNIHKVIATTAVYDLCRGIPEIAKLRAERDGAKILSETAQEKIYAIKTRIRIVEQDIQNDYSKS